MDTCEVNLTAPRSGSTGSFGRGDPMTVSLLEAGRLIASGGCEKPSAAVLKKIEAAQAEAEADAAASHQAAESGAETPDVSSDDETKDVTETSKAATPEDAGTGDDTTSDDTATEGA